MVWERQENYFTPYEEIKDYSVMINRQNFSDQPVKLNIRTYNNILKIMIGQGYDYTTGCLLFFFPIQ